MAGLLKKLFTAVRGGVTEAGEALVDANGIRIYEQEIRDAKNALAKAKENLAGVVASEINAKREIERITGEIQRYEDAAVAALNKDNQELATEIADRIAQLEGELDTQKDALTTFSAQAEQLKSQMKQAERMIRDHERELKLVETREKVQKATASIDKYASSGASTLTDAKASLERIKKRQQERDDRRQAREALDKDFGGDSLDEKLKAAGLDGKVSNSNDVLARLKQKAQGGS